MKIFGSVGFVALIMISRIQANSFRTGLTSQFKSPAIEQEKCGDKMWEFAKQAHNACKDVPSSKFDACLEAFKAKNW